MTLGRTERAFLGAVFALPLVVIFLGSIALLWEGYAGVSTPEYRPWNSDYRNQMQSPSAGIEASILSDVPEPNSANLYRAAFDELENSDAFYERLQRAMPTRSGGPTKPQTAAQVDLADALLAENATMFTLLERAAAGGDCMYILDWSDGLDTMLPHLTRMRQVQRLLCLRMEQHARQNDVEGIVHDMELSLALMASTERDLVTISDFVRYAGYEMVALSLERCLYQLPAPLDDEPLARLTVIVEEMMALTRPVQTLKHELAMFMAFENAARDDFIRSQQARGTWRRLAINTGLRILRMQERDQIVWALYINSLDTDEQYPSLRVARNALYVIEYNREELPRGSIAWRRRLFHVTRRLNQNAIGAIRLRVVYAALSAERVRRVEGAAALEGIGKRLAADVKNSPWIDLHTRSFQRGYSYQDDELMYIQVRVVAGQGVQARSVGSDGIDHNGLRQSDGEDDKDEVFSLWHVTAEPVVADKADGDKVE